MSGKFTVPAWYCLTTKEVLINVVKDAERCTQFICEDGEPCDGLQGCVNCLEIVAQELMQTLIDIVEHDVLKLRR